MVKPLDLFPFYDSKRIGRRHECVECNRARVESNHQSNRDKRLQRMRERYAEDPTRFWSPARRKRANDLARKRNQELRETVVKAYGGKCVCCGEKNPLFLTLDHVNNDGGQMRKKVHTSSSTGLYMWAIKNNYPPALQCLCMNCNWGKARNNGVCPHASKVQRPSR